MSTDYVMAPWPNMKLMDTLVFLSAFLFGLRVGVGVGTLTWLIYGFANPYGPVSPILLFQIVGETFYAIAGAILSRTNFATLVLQRKRLGTRIATIVFVVVPVVGFIGLIGALAYDVLTNTGTWFIQLYDPSKNLAMTLSQSFTIGLITMNFPFPLGIIHQASDMFFFAVATPLVIVATSTLGLIPSRTKRS